MEIDEILLPELLGVDWSPSEGLFVYFLSEFIDRGEYLVVSIKVVEDLIEKFVDVLINPMSVLELSDQLDGVNV